MRITLPLVGRPVGGCGWFGLPGRVVTLGRSFTPNYGTVRAAVREPLYALLATAASVLQSATRGAIYIAAASMSREGFREITTRTWDTFSSHDIEIDEGLYSWESDVYDRFVKPSDRALIVGSGTGRDEIALIESGHEVVGLEPSRPAAEVARRHLQTRGLQAEIIDGRIEQPELVPGTFDVVIFSLNCFTYIQGARNRIAALQLVRDRLLPSGRVIVSYGEIPVHPPHRALAAARLFGRLTRADWSLEPGDMLRLAPGRALQFEHAFTASEAEAEAHDGGLRVAYHRRAPLSPTLVLVV